MKCLKYKTQEWRERERKDMSSCERKKDREGQKCYTMHLCEKVTNRRHSVSVRLRMSERMRVYLEKSVLRV